MATRESDSGNSSADQSPREPMSPLNQLAAYLQKSVDLVRHAVGKDVEFLDSLQLEKMAEEDTESVVGVALAERVAGWTAQLQVAGEGCSQGVVQRQNAELMAECQELQQQLARSERTEEQMRFLGNRFGLENLHTLKLLNSQMSLLAHSIGEIADNNPEFNSDLAVVKLLSLAQLPDSRAIHLSLATLEENGRLHDQLRDSLTKQSSLQATLRRQELEATGVLQSAQKESEAKSLELQYQRDLLQSAQEEAIRQLQTAREESSAAQKESDAKLEAMSIEVEELESQLDLLEGCVRKANDQLQKAHEDLSAKSLEVQSERELLLCSQKEWSSQLQAAREELSSVRAELRKAEGVSSRLLQKKLQYGYQLRRLTRLSIELTWHKNYWKGLLRKVQDADRRCEKMLELQGIIRQKTPKPQLLTFKQVAIRVWAALKFRRAGRTFRQRLTELKIDMAQVTGHDWNPDQMTTVYGESFFGGHDSSRVSQSLSESLVSNSRESHWSSPLKKA